MQGRMPFIIGEHLTWLAGGSYLEKPEGYVGIKMAREINLPCQIDVPTEDFSIPNEADLISGLLRAVYGLAVGYKMYVGCMGGTGRTGLFMAALAKANNVVDPIYYVRGTYKRHAVETQQQASFIGRLDVTPVKALIEAAKAYYVVQNETVFRLATVERFERCFPRPAAVEISPASMLADGMR